MVSGYYDDLADVLGTPFQVRQASDMSIAYSGVLSLVAGYDASSGEKVLKADFTGLNEPGGYVLTVDGVAEPSVAFRIGDGSIYSTLLNDVQKFFYFQRANVDLLAENAGIFARTGEHKEDYNLSVPVQSDDHKGCWWRMVGCRRLGQICHSGSDSHLGSPLGIRELSEPIPGPFVEYPGKRKRHRGFAGRDQG